MEWVYGGSGRRHNLFAATFSINIVECTISSHCISQTWSNWISAEAGHDLFANRHILHDWLPSYTSHCFVDTSEAKRDCKEPPTSNLSKEVPLKTRQTYIWWFKRDISSLKVAICICARRQITPIRLQYKSKLEETYFLPRLPNIGFVWSHLTRPCSRLVSLMNNHQAHTFGRATFPPDF